MCQDDEAKRDLLGELSIRRQLPAELAALAEQSLLNLVTANEETTIIVTVNGVQHDFGATLRDRAESINMNFDSMMVKLGFPEGTGKLI